MDHRPHPLGRAGAGRQPRAEPGQYPAQHRFGGDGDDGDESQKQHEGGGLPAAGRALVEQAGNDGELATEDGQRPRDAFGPFEEQAERVRLVMCGCPRRCKRFLNGFGDDRVQSCVRPRSAALAHAAGQYGDKQTRCRSEMRARSSLTNIAFPGLDQSDQFALTVLRPPSSPTHQRRRVGPSARRQR